MTKVRTIQESTCGLRLGAQCTVARANAQPANNYLEPASSDGLLYEWGTESPFRSLKQKGCLHAHRDNVHDDRRAERYVDGNRRRGRSLHRRSENHVCPVSYTHLR